MPGWCEKWLTGSILQTSSLIVLTVICETYLACHISSLATRSHDLTSKLSLGWVHLSAKLPVTLAHCATFSLSLIETTRWQTPAGHSLYDDCHDGSCSCIPIHAYIGYLHSNIGTVSQLPHSTVHQQLCRLVYIHCWILSPDKTEWQLISATLCDEDAVSWLTNYGKWHAYKKNTNRNTLCPKKVTPFSSTWPHLRCDVGLEEGEYRENCLWYGIVWYSRV